MESTNKLANEFVNLYVQTEYSILNSTVRIKSILDKLQKENCTYASICDDGNMYGHIKFYKECLNRNIKPILGLHITYKYNDHDYQLLLYAMNNYGYTNLMKISSRFKLMNNQIDYEYIVNNSLGLIVIYPQFENNTNQAMINLLYQSFNNFYLGLSINNISTTEFLNMYNIYKSQNISMVALWKVNFIDNKEYDTYRTLKAIANGGEFTNVQKGEYNYCYLSQEELLLAYQEYPDLIKNTINISMNCQVSFNFEQYLLPVYDEKIIAKDYLSDLCHKGLAKRLKINQINNQIQIDRYYKRLQKELLTIDEMGFNDYFLIVWDYVKYAKNSHIYVGPGRGSAAASLVAYSLGITDVDPLKYNLLFERFLNKERISMPDIDIDFPDNERDKIIQYVLSKYGIDRVAHITTFGTFKSRLAIRDCARVYKLKDQRLKQILKYLPEEYHNNKTLNDVINDSSELLQMMDDYDDVRQVLIVASSLEGLPRNISVHPAGIVITKYDLVNFTPLDLSLDNMYQTQFEASDLEALGLLKMDLLGLRNLTIISNTLKLIENDTSLNNIDDIIPRFMDDKLTYQMLAKGDCWGVFQLESAGMKKVIIDMKTSSFDDITNAIALYRPGPMDIIPTFIKRKFKQEEVVYPHPDLEPILKSTYGTIVYQEQILLIAWKFAGYSLGRADILRKAVSKKNLITLEKERTEFVKSCQEQGYSKEVSNEIYDYIVKFANYGFNKAHSVSYAKVAYQTAYLKCHYLIYYLATLMTSVIGSSEINFYYKEGLKRQVTFISPSINQSMDSFIIKDQQIIFPLSIISGLGNVKIQQIIALRNEALFTSYEDFIIRTKDFLSEALVYNIIYSGGLDEFKLTKKAMIENYQILIAKNQYSFLPNLIHNEYTIEEYTYKELLEKEHDAIGINIKYNFFLQYRNIYETERLIKINQVQENFNKGFYYVKTLGMIKNIKEIKTKQNELMAFITIEDDLSTLELILFPTIYSHYHDLTINQIIIIKGKAQLRNVIQVVVDEIKQI